MNEEPAKEGAGFENGLNEDIPGTRERQPTEKGREEKVRRLKHNQTAKLTAVSKQRNALTRLVKIDSNLHLVKSELDVLNTLFREYQEACTLHYREVEEDQ